MVSMFTRHGTSAYRLDQYTSPFSFTLVRLRDNASAFFQGEDADLWDRNMSAIEGIRRCNTLDKSFDYLCSGYDDVLTLATATATVHATVQHASRRMNGGRTIGAVLNDPSASDWLKNALRTALVRDCVDAARDAATLSLLLDVRAEKELRP